MKKIVLFLLCSLNLMAYNVKHTQDRTVTIYPNKALISDILFLNNSGDKSNIEYNEISKNIDINSLNLLGANLKSFQLKKPINYNTLLESYIGKDIVVENNRKTYNITLLNYDKKIIGRNKKTGKIYIFNNPYIKLSSNNINYINKKNSLIMNIDKLNNKNTKKLTLSYLTYGLNINIYHKLNLENNKLDTFGHIYNNSGIDLKNVKVNIISKLNNKNRYMMAVRNMSDRKILSKVDDQIEYRLNNRLSIKNGSENNIKLNEKQVSLTERYLYTASSYSKNPTRIIEIKNNSDSAISMGKIYVWNKQHFLGDGNIGFIPKGDKFDLRLDRNFNIKIERSLKSNVSISDKLRKKNIEIKIENSSNKNIKLELIYNELPRIWSKLKSNEKYTKISNNAIKFKISLNKNSDKKIIFSFVEEKK